MREAARIEQVHLGCNVLFLLHYVLNDKFNNNDDRRIK